jgi:hypothetical protein
MDSLVEMKSFVRDLNLNLISNSNYTISDVRKEIGKHLDDMTRVIIKFNSL